VVPVDVYSVSVVTSNITCDIADIQGTRSCHISISYIVQIRLESFGLCDGWVGECETVLYTKPRLCKLILAFPTNNHIHPVKQVVRMRRVWDC
jgi:hypothetical protein